MQPAGSSRLPDDFSAEFDLDFLELFSGFENAEVLSGLEVDHSEIMAYFPSPDTVAVVVETMEVPAVYGSAQQEEAKVVPEREEIASVKFEKVLSCGMMEEASLKMLSEVISLPAPEKEKGRKPSARNAKGCNGKKKLKVDWTPELHRQFVQAVEQLGVEKAVPSRILELMETDRLTRHNVASHLQKYRYSRKHMLVRDAKAASQCLKRQAYAMTIGNTIGHMGVTSPWMVAPTIGFPSGTLLQGQITSYKSLHVWGHPIIDQFPMHMRPPMHLFPIKPTPSSPWVAPYQQFSPPYPLPHASPCSTHFSSGTLAKGRPYFPQQVPALRFPSPPMPGIQPHSMDQPEDALSAAMPLVPELTKLIGWQLHHEAHPSKESIDATIEEVLTQPWLPMPLGLKPPSLERVMLEQQKQGIPTLPPCS